ncbi:polysaccharide deacetylase family protein [Nocardioides hankookensis]|uniref:Polysaccharide deacetylase family protein n=1 Tax=Nocardioides hankookensis TaxID=443157 RepID=A0ABW1LPQ0_9ACTN
MSSAVNVLVAGVGPLRRRVRPGLAGIGPTPHIALTYDDGPDPVSTPAFLRLLDRTGQRATFFVLGEHAVRHPVLVREMAAAGHELAVHGWDHRCVLRERPDALREGVRRTAGILGDLIGAPVRWYRPPYGVLSPAALAAARDTGLRTVLWSAWGRDWERRATPSRIVTTVDRTLRPGGTLLLHDTDRTAAAGSWRRTLAASELLLTRWAATGADVGPLRAHGLRPERVPA